MNDKLHYIEQTDSTNNRLKQMLADGIELPDGYTLYTFFQTAGRGQAGNSWESEQGKNLLFSTLILPKNLPATQQFCLSMLVPLTIVNALNSQLSTTLNTKLSTLNSKIKWPNDIYVGDRKLAGILIENTLEGQHVKTSVAGIGLNVNQTCFLSSAPNPVSLCQLTGREYDLHSLMEHITCELQALMPQLHEPEELKRQYMQHLYHAEGFHLYAEREVSVEPVSIALHADQHQFEAEIADIDDYGRLCLRLRNGELRRYHFKEIKFILP